MAFRGGWVGEFCLERGNEGEIFPSAAFGRQKFPKFGEKIFFIFFAFILITPVTCAPMRRSTGEGLAIWGELTNFFCGERVGWFGLEGGNEGIFFSFGCIWQNVPKFHEKYKFYLSPPFGYPPVSPPPLAHVWGESTKCPCGLKNQSGVPTQRATVSSRPPPQSHCGH